MLVKATAIFTGKERFFKCERAFYESLGGLLVLEDAKGNHAYINEEWNDVEVLQGQIEEYKIGG